MREFTKNVISCMWLNIFTLDQISTSSSKPHSDIPTALKRSVNILAACCGIIKLLSPSKQTVGLMKNNELTPEIFLIAHLC